MRASSWLLFMLPVVVWSTTFFAITFQLHGPTSEIFSVGLRFLFASALVFLLLRIRGGKMHMVGRDHHLAFASGVFAYGLSYVFTYIAERDIPSGLVAIAFTLMVFLTPLFSWIGLGRRAPRSTWIGGLLGFFGVLLCFAPGLISQTNTQFPIPSLLMMLFAAAASSISAVLSMRLNERGVPVMTYTAWSMLYGAMTTLVYGLITGQSFVFDPRPSFWAAFAYLTVCGTVLTFLSYLELMRREGSAIAMYVGVFSPLGALLVSLFIEKLVLSPVAASGLGLALIGAVYTVRARAGETA